MECLRLVIGKPSQVTIEFSLPENFFIVKNSIGKVYYARNIGEVKKNVFKFNISDTGVFYLYSNKKCLGYSTNVIPAWKPLAMPKVDHNFSKPLKVIKTNQYKSPASIKPRAGEVFINPKLENYPIYAQRFILAHERGHFFYSGSGLESEENCDLFAINWIMKHGGNLSTCFVTMEAVLKRNPQNMERMKTFFNNLILTYNHG